MPGMDGFSLCREWMADETLRPIPLIFYTATYTDPKDEAFALSLGAARFIVKPAEPDAFIEILEEVLGNHVAGRFGQPDLPRSTDEAYYQQYNQALIRKLEDKMAQLEEANGRLKLDIAAREVAEAEREVLTTQVRDQAHQMEQILVSVPEGVLLITSSGQIAMANPKAEEYLALLAAGRVGDTLTRLGDQPLGRLLTSPPTQGLWHEVRAGPHIFEVIARPVVNGAEPEHYVLVINDVTREREARARIEQQERLAAVGQLAAGIAHDFNNILAVIVLYAQMDLHIRELPSRVREHLKTIAHEAQQASHLVQQILDFGRRAVLEPRPMNLVPFLQERVQLLKRTLPETIRIEFNRSSDEIVMRADPTRMQQMVTNLAVNARDAMPNGGTLSITLDETRIERHRPVPVPGMTPGHWIRIEVSDAGVGMPPEIQAHLFEPFYTTKEPGKGTGLGLAQVYGIVKQHEGHIRVETAEGQGTTFTIYLPSLQTTSVEDQPTLAAALPQGHRELILIVEDNAAVRQALAGILALLNYRTLEASNGQEALALLERQAAEIDLILSDMVMPDMGGQALFYALQARDITIPMVTMTGHPMMRELHKLRAEGLAGWVLKPPRMEQLAHTLDQALREATSSVRVKPDSSVGELSASG